MVSANLLLPSDLIDTFAPNTELFALFFSFNLKKLLIALFFICINIQHHRSGVAAARGPGSAGVHGDAGLPAICF